MVNKITFKNFKLFKRKQTLELKPITLLIGKNNTGKSAVLRLPTLIAVGLKGEPLNWVNKIGNDRENSIELGSDFKDLVYNRNGTGIIELGIFNANTHIEVAINEEYGVLSYLLNGENREDISSVKGLLIHKKPYEDLTLAIDYLGAMRAEPAYDYPFSEEIYSKIGIKGQNAYPILIQDFKNQQKLIPQVSEWYKLNFEGWKLLVLENKTITGITHQVAITHSHINAVNLKQTGQGIYQVLPLIVRSFMKEQEPTLIIIEEPETHLHPAAHGNLAERLVDSYREDNNKQYLIETHSQNFVLRMRRLVAEGKLNKEELAIYYVDFDEVTSESNLIEIEVDEDGEVEWWPSGIFNESLAEVIELRKAQDSK